MAIPRVYLIDSSIYIFRAWHIYDTSITDRDGRPANAVFGFADFLYQFISQKQPTHIACAFDASQSSSYRKELYPQYKANRDPAPEELKHQFALCRELCRAIGLAEFGSDRFEADDIIGSLADHYRRRGFAVTVVSADKDLAQLVTGPEDQWWDFARGNMLDAKGVKQHFGVHPHQIADMLALSGDKVDNIPGIPGVGYTTAARLLQKFGSMEFLLDNVQEVAAMKFRGAARVQALLHAHGHILPLNKQLTTVVTDMPFGESTDITLRGLDNPVFEQLMDRLAHGNALQQRWLNLFS
jgi:DNA polymerase-1